jgi:chromosomal replication initiation ATPase DnaA
MTASEQLPLDLGHRPALGRTDFLVTDASREAIGWIDSWPNWPSYGLGIYGPPGCGKSHLSHVFAAKANAHILDDNDLRYSNPVVLASEHNALVWDDANEVLDEQALFHLFNAVREAGKHFLVVSRAAPARWTVTLLDLKSRLAGMPAVEIGMPDDATIMAVLVKLFRDRQVEVTPDLVDYIGNRVPRTFGAAQALVDQVDRQALAQNRRITVPFVRGVLKTFNI